MGGGEVFKQAPGNVAKMANIAGVHAVVRVTDFERKYGQMLAKCHNGRQDLWPTHPKNGVILPNDGLSNEFRRQS